MHRKEYDLAVSTLFGMCESDIRYGSGDTLKIAAQLEERFPEQILAFYMGLLGRLDHNMQRKIYAQKAGMALKVRHLWLGFQEQPRSNLCGNPHWRCSGTIVRHMDSRIPSSGEDSSWRAIRGKMGSLSRYPVRPTCSGTKSCLPGHALRFGLLSGGTQYSPRKTRLSPLKTSAISSPRFELTAIPLLLPATWPACCLFRQAKAPHSGVHNPSPEKGNAQALILCVE
jgi:hypothetical protein